MTNLRQDTVTDDVEQRKVESIKGSLDKLIFNKGNPHRQLKQDRIDDKISSDELHKTLRGKLLKNVYKMKKQKYPPKPTIIKEEKLSKSEIENIMQGWGEACIHIDCVNAGNKHWLGVLLKDMAEGKLQAEQGKEEEIEELLSEWYERN